MACRWHGHAYHHVGLLKVMLDDPLAMTIMITTMAWRCHVGTMMMTMMVLLLLLTPATEFEEQHRVCKNKLRPLPGDKIKSRLPRQFLFSRRQGLEVQEITACTSKSKHFGQILMVRPLAISRTKAIMV